MDWSNTVRIKRTYRKPLLFAAVLVAGTLFFGGKALAAPGPFGTQLNYGYFNQRYDPDGDNVINGGITANSIPNFEAEVESLSHSASPQQRIGAAFIINTMLRRNQNAAQYPIDAADIAAWEDAVENPNIKINFNEPLTFCVNSYWQNNVNDDAFFRKTGGTCWTPNEIYGGVRVGNSITFRDKATNALLYSIRRQCGNPNGATNNIPGLPTPAPANFNLHPVIAYKVNGVLNGSAEAGDTVQFIYNITNTGPDPTANPTCRAYLQNYTGYHATPNPPILSGAGIVPQPNCAQSFPGFHSVTTLTETRPNMPGNVTFCRAFSVSPATSAGITRSVETCVVVSNKPYFKVFGGDVSAGNGFNNGAAACTPVVNKGGIVGWNKGTASSYTGSGTQYGALALLNIHDFSSAQGNAAWRPTGLSFANTTYNVSNGLFGGAWGATSCIPDYYSKVNSAPAPIQTTLPTSIASMDGVYKIAGDVTLNAGTVPVGKRTQIFVDGNVYIAGNIDYAGGWSILQTPLFEVIAKGNIYIKNSVSQLDGVYIAQPNNLTTPTDGTIFTCATAPNTPAARDVNLFSNCNTKLRVNGAFVANQVQLLRTPGTLSQSSTVESAGSNNAAEIFNYTPAEWMAQPPSSTPSAASSYDSITELPPIL